MRGPVGCVVAVTYRCSARCLMCDIWKRPREARPELAAEDYRWLPASLRSINVSGGEPFLRDDLVDVVRVMQETCARARIVISTNGLAPDRIERAAAAMNRIAVRVSVDAVGAAHDRARGVEGAYGLAIETVRRLKALGIRDLGLAATSMESTAGELEAVERLAGEMGVRFVASVAHSSPIYFGAQEGERPRSEAAVGEIAAMLRRQLRSPRPADWAKAYYTRGLVEYVLGRPRMLPCRRRRGPLLPRSLGRRLPVQRAGAQDGERPRRQLRPDRRAVRGGRPARRGRLPRAVPDGVHRGAAHEATSRAAACVDRRGEALRPRHGRASETGGEGAGRRMTVLTCNKYHFVKGGAERYVFELGRILTAKGHTVVPFAMEHERNEPSPHSDLFVSHEGFARGDGLVGRLRGAARVIYCVEARRKIEALVDRTRPDVAHAHNIAHQLSPSILYGSRPRASRSFRRCTTTSSCVPTTRCS